MSQQAEGQSKAFYSLIESAVYNILQKEKLDIRPWHNGKVTQVLSPTKLKVCVDGSDVEQTISCSKNEPYKVGDEVWVVYINNNARNKFVFGLRGVSN